MVIKNLVYSLVNQVIFVFISFGSLAILGRLLEPNIFGIFALLIAIHSLLFPIVDFGLTPAYIKIKEVTNETKNVFFTLNILLGIIYSVIFIIIASLINEKYFIKYSLVFIISVLVIAYNQQSLAHLTREHQQKKLMLINSISVLTSAIIAITLAFMSYGIYALLAQHLSNQLVRALLLKRTYSQKYKLVNFIIIKKYYEDILFSFKILSSRVINGISLSYDKFLVSNMFGITSLGYYSKSFDLARFPNASVGVALSSPILAFLARKPKDQARELYVVVSNIIFFLSANILIFLVFYGDWFVVFLLGDQWKEAGIYLRILSIWGIGKVMHGILITIYTNEKLMGMFTIYSIVALLINFIIFCLTYYVTKEIVCTIMLFSISNFLIWITLYLYSINKYSPNKGLKDSILFFILNSTIFIVIIVFLKYQYFINSEYKWLVAISIYSIAMLSTFLLIFVIKKSLLLDIIKLKE